MSRYVTYGPGGYNPDAPDDNIVSVEEVPDPPQPDPEPVAADTVIASLAAMTEDQKAALRLALGL